MGISGGFPPFLDKKGSLCLNCLFKQQGLCWTPAFLLGVWHFDMCWPRMAMGPAPGKHPHEYLEASLVDSIPHILICCWGYPAHATWAHWGSWGPAFTSVPFPLWAVSCPPLSHGLEQDYMLSPGSPPGESSKLAPQHKELAIFIVLVLFFNWEQKF